MEFISDFLNKFLMLVKTQNKLSDFIKFYKNLIFFLDLLLLILGERQNFKASLNILQLI